MLRTGMQQGQEFMVLVEAERVQVAPGTTAGDLKEQFGVDPEDAVLYWDGGSSLVRLEDHHRVRRWASDGAPVVFDDATDESLKRFWKWHGREAPQHVEAAAPEKHR